MMENPINSLGFERYLRHIMPKKLNLSEAKSAAIESVFEHFADVLRPLESKAQEEYQFFMQEFVRNVEEASRMRCPKDYIIRNGHYVAFQADTIETPEKKGEH